MKFTEDDFIYNTNILRSYNYDCLNILKENINENYFYNIFLSAISYKLKNIWNHIVINWIQIHNNLINNKEFIKSEYYSQKYKHNHNNIDDNKFNELLNDFIDGNKFKALFVVMSIKSYI